MPQKLSHLQEITQTTTTQTTTTRRELKIICLPPIGGGDIIPDTGITKISHYARVVQTELPDTGRQKISHYTTVVHTENPNKNPKDQPPHLNSTQRNKSPTQESQGLATKPQYSTHRNLRHRNPKDKPLRHNSTHINPRHRNPRDQLLCRSNSTVLSVQ